MKYWAMLKDSFLEAIDTKVFYCTAGCSLVLILVLASLSFKPVPAEEAFQSIVGDFSQVFPNRGQSMQVQMRRADYQLRDLSPLQDTADPQDAGYAFTLTASEPLLRNAVSTWDSSSGQPVEKPDISDSLLKDFIRSQFELHGNVNVVKVERAGAPSPGMIAFRIETSGATGVRGWLHDPCLLFGAIPMKALRHSLGRCVHFIEDSLINGFGAWVGILVGVVVTAFFIPNMVRKGTVDLLLVKPIHRTTLLIYKYFGGLTFVFLNAVLAVGGTWLVLGLRSGIWSPAFLGTILVLTFFFAILYAVSALFGVLTQSAIVSILMTCLVWFVLWCVGTTYTALELIKKDPVISETMPIPGWLHSTVGYIHMGLPRTQDLNILVSKLLGSETLLTRGEISRMKLDQLPDITWGESLGVSAAFVAVLLGIACWKFARRDY
jgi:ABC-type transport system involved in multi-copper enzyme maturation permease subunit